MKISGIVLVAGWSVGNCLLRVQEQFAAKKKLTNIKRYLALR